jgi:lysophospholipase L1-like esterase
MSQMLLFLAGLGLLAGGLLYNEVLLGLALPPARLEPARVAAVRNAQLCLLGAGAVLFLASRLARHLPPLSRLLARPAAPNLLLILLTLLVPLFGAEVVLRPFAKFDPVTSLYLPDPDLGWKHRPGARDEWKNVVVTINGKGLRGPELPYEKPAGTFRILWLGDSVLFGDKVQDDAKIFPHLVEQRLKANVPAPVETVNSGVSGYSTWQEAAYLEKEGLRYAPDLVVVVFVLNDVTERLELLRFGGYWEGWQLSRSPTSRVARLLRRSSIVYFSRKLGGRLRFGADVRQGARAAEVLDVRSLVERPGDPRVREAWDTALADLGRIVATGKTRGIPVALVVTPFTFQLAEPELPPAPQQILARWARERSVPFLDLLPPLRAVVSDKHLAPGHLFIDHCHLTVVGHDVVAQLVADWLASRHLVPAPKSAR